LTTFKCNLTAILLEIYAGHYSYGAGSGTLTSAALSASSTYFLAGRITAATATTSVFGVFNSRHT
jgi:hypothetical protein